MVGRKKSQLGSLHVLLDSENRKKQSMHDRKKPRVAAPLGFGRRPDAPSAKGGLTRKRRRRTPNLKTGAARTLTISNWRSALKIQWLRPLPLERFRSLHFVRSALKIVLMRTGL